MTTTTRKPPPPKPTKKQKSELTSLMQSKPRRNAVDTTGLPIQPFRPMDCTKPEFAHLAQSRWPRREPIITPNSTVRATPRFPGKYER